jgi:hypothetical protein
MRNASRLAPLLVVSAALLLIPACSNNSPTIGDVIRAGIILTVDPSPVPPSQNLITGVVSIGYNVTITEFQGLGGEIQFVSAKVYDPASGGVASFTYFDSADLIVFVGSKRVEPGGQLVVPQTTSYILPDLSTNALLSIDVQMKDDKDNLINQSLLVKIEPPAEATGSVR